MFEFNLYKNCREGYKIHSTILINFFHIHKWILKFFSSLIPEKQKQACANEFIHAEMTMEQAKRRVLNAPTVSF